MYEEAAVFSWAKGFSNEKEFLILQYLYCELELERRPFGERNNCVVAAGDEAVGA